MSPERSSSATLVEASPFDGPDCPSRPEVGSAARVLHVDYLRSPHQRIRQWSRRADEPAALGIVRVGISDDEAAAVERSVDGDERAVTVRAVERPQNLTALGLALVDLLESWAVPGDTHVCVHSLTAMLQYVGADAVGAFVREVTRQCARHGAAVHFHVDPTAHRRGTVERLRGLVEDARPGEEASSAGVA